MPSERAECSPDTVMVVNEASCLVAQQSVSLNLSNRGLFNVTAAFIRINREGKEVRTQLNKDKEVFPIPIAPDNILHLSYQGQNVGNAVQSDGNYIIEIQPAVLSKGTLVPCKTGVVTFPVVCS